MKEFNFPINSQLVRVNHILTTDLPYDSSHDGYPDDYHVAIDIQNYALAFSDCARIVSKSTMKSVKIRTGHSLKYAEKILVDGYEFFIVSSNSEISKLEKANIPTYIPRK